MDPVIGMSFTVSRGALYIRILKGAKIVMLRTR